MAREMKDSGVPWIGKIPANWTAEKLKFLTSFCQEKYQEELGDLTYVGLENVVSWNGKFVETESEYDRSQALLFTRNDLLWGKLRPYLAKVFHCQENGCCSGEFCVIRPNAGINVRFLWNTLISTGFVSTVDQSTYGAKMPRANADFIKNMLIPVPPATEQESIGATLDRKCAEIDAVLDKIRLSIEAYKKLKQAIITQAVTKGIRGDRPMKDSGIGWVKEIPVEWDTIPSKYVFSNSDERKRPNDELLTASQKHGIISQQKYMEKEDTRIVLANKGIEDWKHVEPYDFIISLRSFQGGLEMSEVSGCITWHYIVLKAKIPLHSFYFKWLFKSELYIKALQRTCNFIRDGQDLRYSNFTQVPLFIPPLEEQVDIANYLSEKCTEIDSLIERKSRLLSELEAYKKSLIYEYVTGKKEVVVKEVEEIVIYPYFPATTKASRPRFAQAVLMSKVLDECSKKMGRVKLEKIMFVLENDIGFDFCTEYMREAAGPFDASIYECEGIISKRNKWFAISSLKHAVSYKPAKDIEKYKKYYAQYFTDYEVSIDRIINIFRDYTTDQAEIIATLYGAWNDFIIDKRSYSDDDIVNDVLNNWNDSKKRFSKDVWLRAIQKMREIDLVPHGYGKHTVIKERR